MADLADYELAWPRDLFTAEAENINHEPDLADDQYEATRALLAEAFTSDRVVAAYENGRWLGELPPAWGDGLETDERDLVTLLVRNVEDLPVAGERRPYWSERSTGAPPQALDTATTRASFARLVDELYEFGYFDLDMPRGCVDDRGSGVDPRERLATHLGRPELWPLNPQDWDDATFFDLIELFGDLAARPRLRHWHRWNQCGWHAHHYDRRVGRHVYRTQVNQLLARSEYNYQLADSGQDAGRLVAIVGDQRDDLVEAMVERTDPVTSDKVREAIKLFRARDATVEAKRMAITTLYGVWEPHRTAIFRNREVFLEGDEDALFGIANQFAISHQDARQRTDYDPVFLDWLFWWYLATVRLLDQLLDRQNTTAPTNSPTTD